MSQNTCSPTPYENKDSVFTPKPSPYTPIASPYSTATDPFSAKDSKYTTKEFCPVLLQENGRPLLQEDRGTIKL